MGADLFSYNTQYNLSSKQIKGELSEKTEKQSFLHKGGQVLKKYQSFYAEG